MGWSLRRVATMVGAIWLLAAMGPGAGAAAPAATTATLNLQVRAAGAAIVIRVNTLGGPPAATAAAPIWLVNDEGLSLTKVWVISRPSPRCQSAPVHFVPVGPAPYTANTDWCLNIRLPPYGSQVAGVLHGSRATIAITVEHQAAWGWPIFWAALGLAIALGVVLVASARFSALAPRVRLHLIAWKEAGKRLEREPRKILGLTHLWRREARRGGGVIGDVVVVSFQFIPMIVAGGSALASVYLTNKTFGTRTDYLTLMLATAGSSAVAAGAAAVYRVLTPAAGSMSAPGRVPPGPAT